VYGQFPYHENTGTFNATTNATGKYDAFDWAWMGYDDQIINVTLLPSGSTAVAFRMCYPRRGTVYLESTTGTLTGGTNYSLSIARTNLPPNGIYFAEFMGYENNVTTMPTRVLATGQINIQQSLWQNTAQSTWTNPLAGTVIGPPVHTLSALSGWPFLTTNTPDNTTIILTNGKLTAVGFDPAGSAAAVSNWADAVFVPLGTFNSFTGTVAYFSQLGGAAFAEVADFDPAGSAAAVSNAAWAQGWVTAAILDDVWGSNYVTLAQVVAQGLITNGAGIAAAGGLTNAAAFATAAQGTRADMALTNASAFDPAGSAAAVSNAAFGQGWINAESDTNALAQLQAHTERTDNPHGLTAASIGADPAGAAAGVLGDFTELLNGHSNRTDNPHGVTAAQVGALTNAAAFDAAGAAAAVSNAAWAQGWISVEADTNALAQLSAETNRAQVAEALLYPRNNPSGYVDAAAMSVATGTLGAASREYADAAVTAGTGTLAVALRGEISAISGGSGITQLVATADAAGVPSAITGTRWGIGTNTTGLGGSVEGAITNGGNASLAAVTGTSYSLVYGDTNTVQMAASDPSASALNGTYQWEFNVSGAYGNAGSGTLNPSPVGLTTASIDDGTQDEAIWTNSMSGIYGTYYPHAGTALGTVTVTLPVNLTNTFAHGVGGQYVDATHLNGTPAATIISGAARGAMALTNAAAFDPAGSAAAVSNWADAVFVPLGTIITPTLAASNDFAAAWYPSNALWTNAAGWVTDGATGAVSVALDDGEYIRSPLLAAGYSSHTSTSSGGIGLVTMISTDAVTWVMATATGAPVYVRWTASTGPVVPGSINQVVVSGLSAWGWSHPERVGGVVDFGGAVLRADDPGGERDVATAGYVARQIAAIAVSAQWSDSPAVSAVDLAGQALDLDPRYRLAISNGVLSLSVGGEVVWEVLGSGTSTPVITHFALAGTSITMRVVATVDWEPYPEWSTNLADWTAYPTNEFTSTWPALTNSQVTLQFGTVPGTTAYYRVAATQVATNPVSLAIRVPVRVDGPMTGNLNMGGYSITNIADIDATHLGGTPAATVIAGAARGAMAVTNLDSGVASRNITALIANGTATITRAMGPSIYVAGGAPLTLTVQGADWAATDIGVFALGIYSTGQVAFLPATMTNASTATWSTTATNNLIFFRGVGGGVWVGR
jgi:hypothetical protein